MTFSSTEVVLVAFTIGPEVWHAHRHRHPATAKQMRVQPLHSPNTGPRVQIRFGAHDLWVTAEDAYRLADLLADAADQAEEWGEESAEKIEQVWASRPLYTSEGAV